MIITDMRSSREEWRTDMANTATSRLTRSCIICAHGLDFALLPAIGFLSHKGFCLSEREPFRFVPQREIGHVRATLGHVTCLACGCAVQVMSKQLP